jgi:hypothetical protein
MFAYRSRIASGDYDLRSGFAAWTWFSGIHAASLFVLSFLPAGLLQLSQAYFGHSEVLETTVALLIFGGVAIYVFRILIPVGFDVVWRMDILSNKMGFVRPNDVYRLFAIWLSPTGKDLPLLRRWFRDA